MAKQFDGSVEVAFDGTTVITLDASSGNITSGAAGRDGDLVLKDGQGNTRIHLDAQDGLIIVQDAMGRDTLRFDGRYSVIDLGGPGSEGDLRIHDESGQAVLTFDAHYALLELGAAGNEGDLRVRDDNGDVRIHLDGNAGDIKLVGADCAEEFAVQPGMDLDPGTVMVIGDDEELRPSDQEYDLRVAGVLSGAGGLTPGVVLGRPLGGAATRSRLPLALCGRVICKVDATVGPVHTGDLLTTAARSGHAMRAVDRARGFGAILGKALRPLDAGTGLVPVLVALQ